jgi:large subunit ribosomal protein L10
LREDIDRPAPMRAEKKQIVDELAGQLSGAKCALLTDYTGLTVGQFAELRKRLRAAGAEYHVVKNSMLGHAMKAAGLPSPDGSLTGMTAMVLGGDNSDITAVAKVVKQFSKEFEKPKFKLGVLGRQLLQAEEVSAMADLPALESLRAQLIGLLQAPATRIATVLGAPATQIARVLQAHADKQGAPPAAPA